MFRKQRLWIGTVLLIVLVLTPTSLVGGSKQTTQVSTDADSAQQVALASNAASIEAGMPAMRSETLSTLAAQGDDCDFPDAGERMKCKSEKLVAEACNGAALVAQDDAGLYAQSTKEELDNLCTYGKAAVAAADPAEFKSVGMRRKAGGGAGAVMEYVGDDEDNDGDDDGICKPKGKKDADVSASNDGHGDGKKPTDLYKEWCAEVIGDGIGDDDGFCEYQGKAEAKYLEPCVRVLGVDAIDGQEENFDEDKLNAYEKALDDQTKTLRAGNVALAAAMEELRAQQAISRELLMGNAKEACANLMNTGDYGERPRWDSMKILLGFTIGGEGFYDACDSALNLDVVGFNGSPACTPLAVGKAVYAGLYQSEELRDDMITGLRLDNAVECLQYLGEKISEISNGVNEANAKIDHVVEHRRVHLQVVEVKEKREFLVSATEAGKPSQNSHEIVEEHTVRVSEKQALSFVDVTASTTWTPQGAGLYLVVIDLPQGLNNAELFVFEVWHTENYTVTINDKDEQRSTVHSGFTLFDRSAQNNAGLGQ